MKPIYWGILFNLLMTMANFTIPYRSAVGRWYFKTSSPIVLMILAWIGFIAWQIAWANGWR